MKLIKKENEYGLTLFLEDDDKVLEIVFGRNGDLYWIIRSKNESNNHTITITKENYEIYKLFVSLFDDIENINLLDHDYANVEKEYYIKSNYSNYNELYNKDNGVITWYSDETNHNVANILKIKKEKELFIIDFITQEDKEEYDRDFKSPKHIVIRFRNSGSRYNPFNIVFMRMYRNMINIVDVNENEYQNVLKMK